MTVPGIDPETFERLVARITADTPLSDAELEALRRDPASYACAAELDAIWHLVGGLDSAPRSAASSGSSTRNGRSRR